MYLRNVLLSFLACLITITQVVATECIAPASPGGGWDFTCRSVAKIMYDIKAVDKHIQVTNMSGAGGGIAYSHVVHKRKSDEELIVAASSSTATRLAQNAYAGLKYHQVKFLGAIGIDPSVIVVSKNSLYQTLNDLIEAVKKDPKKVAFAGGSATGGLDHLNILRILNKSGYKDIRSVRYIGVDSGAEAVTQTIGGFTQAMTGDLSETIGFLKSGDIRILAVLSEKPVPGFEDIKTAKEQGIDLVIGNWRGFYVPNNISDKAYAEWSEKLKKVSQSKEWENVRKSNGLASFTLIGRQFQEYVSESVQEMKKISKEIGVIQ